MKIPHHKIDCEFDEFMDKFKKENKLKYLDSGCFGAVYEPNKTSDYVYKVGRLNANRTDGYLCFIKNIVLKAKNNPFLPVIHAMSMYTYYDEWANMDVHFYVIKMERLFNFETLSEKRRSKNLKSHKIDCTVDQGFWGGDIRFLDDWESYVDGDEWESKEKHFMTGYPKQLGAMLTKMRKMVNDTQHIEADIHEGNVMWRKTGGRNRQLVLTDPLC